jgi:hypothetical protein
VTDPFGKAATAGLIENRVVDDWAEDVSRDARLRVVKRNEPLADAFVACGDVVDKGAPSSSESLRGRC